MLSEEYPVGLLPNDNSNLAKLVLVGLLDCIRSSCLMTSSRAPHVVQFNV